MTRVATNERLPALARELFAAQAEEYAQLQVRIDEIDAKLTAWHRKDALGQRLAGIPGVGPVVASLLSMKTPDPGLFRSGRQFPAWIGLTPKDHSTAGKVRLGGTTPAGDEALRSALVARGAGRIDEFRGTKEAFQPPTPRGRPELGRKRADGAVDRPEKRDISWNPAAQDAATLCGARIAEPILASGQARPYRTGRTYGRKRSDRKNLSQPLASGRRPHMDS